MLLSASSFTLAPLIVDGQMFVHGSFAPITLTISELMEEVIITPFVRWVL
jgi:hypothetical protein